MMELGRTICMLRVIRVVRFNSLLEQFSPQLRMGLKSLRQSKSAALNLFSFLVLIIYVYALIGTVAFNRTVKIFPINDKVSFYTVWQSMVLLYQISTSAGWDGVYKALITEQKYSIFLIAVYLLSFLFICVFIVFNLVITVILNFYAQMCEVENERKGLRAADLGDFNMNWEVVARQEQPAFIERSQLSDLLTRLNIDSGLRREFEINDDNIKLLGIPIRNEKQYYRGDVLLALNRVRLSRLSNEN